MTFKRDFIATEDDSKLNWAANNEVTYSVVNKDAPSKYGEYRGWKISPGTYDPFFILNFVCSCH